MTQECLDIRMLMRSIESSRVPVSIAQLQRHWAPVFTYKDVQRMARQLKEQGLVKEVNRAGTAWLASATALKKV